MVKAFPDIGSRPKESENGVAALERGRSAEAPSPTIVWRSASSRLLVSAAAAFSLLLIALGFALQVEALRLVGVFGALIFGAGAAPLQLVDGATIGERCGIAVMLGAELNAESEREAAAQELDDG